MLTAVDVPRCVPSHPLLRREDRSCVVQLREFGLAALWRGPVGHGPYGRPCLAQAGRLAWDITPAVEPNGVVCHTHMTGCTTMRTARPTQFCSVASSNPTSSSSTDCTVWRGPAPKHGRVRAYNDAACCMCNATPGPTCKPKGHGTGPGGGPTRNYAGCHRRLEHPFRRG